MMTRLLLLPLTLALAAVACDNSGPIERGNLTVIDSTLGTPDPDGYVLSVEGQADRLLANHDTTFYQGFPIGDYTVSLGDVEAGCTVKDGASRNRYVGVGNNTVYFEITCP
jgi:hypothetical protein